MSPTLVTGGRSTAFPGFIYVMVLVVDRYLVGIRLCVSSPDKNVASFEISGKYRSTLA
jgi:hypothetical protein